jgi:hypothetical protein
MRPGLGLVLLFAASAGGCATGDRSCGACGPLVCVECCKYCRCCDELHTDLAARRCAWEALRSREAASCDYRHGFVRAYVDLAHGATGALPPVPPERYWSVCFRTCDGHARAREWYAGYADGVASARGGLGAPCETVPSSGTYYRPPGYGGGHAAAWGAGLPGAYQGTGW